jgi:hypothetical protein
VFVAPQSVIRNAGIECHSAIDYFQQVRLDEVRHPMLEMVAYMLDSFATIGLSSQQPRFNDCEAIRARADLAAGAAWPIS